MWQVEKEESSIIKGRQDRVIPGKLKRKLSERESGQLMVAKYITIPG